MVIQDGYCENCGEKYLNKITKWCKSCQTSGNEEVDGFIRDKQSVVHSHHFILECIPYNKLYDIKKIGKDGSDTLYSAMWKGGPLCYEKEWVRKINKKVVLKCLHDSQNFINEFTDVV